MLRFGCFCPHQQKPNVNTFPPESNWVPSFSFSLGACTTGLRDFHDGIMFSTLKDSQRKVFCYPSVPAFEKRKAHSIKCQLPVTLQNPQLKKKKLPAPRKKWRILYINETNGPMTSKKKHSHVWFYKPLPSTSMAWADWNDFQPQKPRGQKFWRRSLERFIRSTSGRKCVGKVEKPITHDPCHLYELRQKTISSIFR